MSKIEEKRLKAFNSWMQLLSSRPALLPNPSHDYGDKWHQAEARSLATKAASLESELAAWEAASDEALENFEQGLSE